MGIEDQLNDSSYTKTINDTLRGIIEDALKKQLETQKRLVMLTGKGGVKEYIKAVMLEFTGKPDYTYRTILSIFRAGWIVPMGKGLYQISA